MSQTSDAERAIHRHFEAINQRGHAGYVGTVAFPFTYQNYNGVSVTINSPSDYGGPEAPYPWDIIAKTDPNWSHSELRGVVELARTEHSAVFKVSFVRVDETSNRSANYDAVWIVVPGEDHWRVVFRHNMGRSAVAS